MIARIAPMAGTAVLLITINEGDDAYEAGSLDGEDVERIATGRLWEMGFYKLRPWEWDDTSGEATSPVMALWGIARVIEALVAYCKLHVPTEDSYGRTCDERGCRICNGTSFTRTAQDWIDSGDPLPFDPDDGGEVAALIAEASEIA